MPIHGRLLPGFGIRAAAHAADQHGAIVGLQHAQANAVTLHWVALGDARGVALRVDYAGLDEVRRETAPLDSEAIKRASGDARRLMGLIAIAFLIVFVQNVWTHGFALPGMLQTLAIASLALGVLLACMKIWQRRLARRQQGMEVLTGPVTEILTGRWGTNGRTYRATWFRVGDTLLCPGGASRGPVAIGDTVTIEILHGEGSGGRAALGAFTVTAAGAASAVRVETD